MLFLFLDTYLCSNCNESQIRIRRRTEVGVSAVHLNMTTRHASIDGQRVETRRNLKKREYAALLAQADPDRSSIKKIRRCFIFNDHYFQLDEYIEPCNGLTLLEGYLDFSLAESPSLKDYIPPVCFN